MKFLLEKSLKKYTFLIASPNGSNTELDIYEVTYKEESLFDAYKKCVEEVLNLEVDDDTTLEELKEWNEYNDSDNDTCIIGIESDEYDESPNDWYYDNVKDSVIDNDDYVTIDDDVLEKWFGINREDYQDDDEDYDDEEKDIKKQVKEIIIPNNVTEIYGHEFSGIDRLISVIIPNSVTEIHGYAFEESKGLVSITIPASVTRIGPGAFSECSGLINVYYNGTIADWCNINFASGTANPIFYTSNFYILDAGGNIEFNGKKYSLITELVIPNSVTRIGENAFEHYESLTEVVIPNSVTSIGDFAFGYCYGLTDIYYQGSKEDWSKIKIGIENGSLWKANIHFNSKQ